MKLTIVGGGSVRTPQLIPALIRRAQRLRLTELWLMDVDAAKLDVIGGLCRQWADQAPFTLHLTTDAKSALSGASHVITSIRPGGEEGRARDERICLDLNVLGQETTGAAGFAMAMRSIPPIAEIADLVRQYGEPDAWLYNFTNPAGLVVQALHDLGFTHVVGICDSANGAQNAVSRFLRVEKNQIHHAVYGLNHLSWCPSVRVGCQSDGSGGIDVLPSLLQEARFVSETHLRLFAPGLLTWQRSFLNEYLYYYYHRDEALAGLRQKPESRGEETLRLTRELLEQLHPSTDSAAATAIYQRSMAAREASYMAHARPGHPPAPSGVAAAHGGAWEDEGYAGVVMNCIVAVENSQPIYTGLNIPNRGAIAGLDDDDVVEVGCWVDAHGIRPEPVGEIPPDRSTLMRAVKLYERLAVRAVLSRDKELAVQALTVHPLVGSYPLASRLLDAFLRAHRDLVGSWKP